MNIFDVDGRIGRMGYFFWMLGIAFLVAVANVIIEANVYRADVGTFAPIYIVAWVFTVFPMIKRLHDLNQPGGFCLLSLVPLLNFGLGLWLLFGRSYSEENKYGAPSQKRTRKNKDKTPPQPSCSEHFGDADVYQQADDIFYQQAYEELESGQIDKGLWGRLFSQSGGDENKAKAQYIKNRVKQLVVQREQEWKMEENVKRVEEAKKHLSLPVGSKLLEAVDAPPETEFIFKCGVPDNEAAQYLLLALQKNNLKELDVGDSIINVGDMKTPASYKARAFG